MERRRITIKRGYLWLTAALLIVLLIVIYIAHAPHQQSEATIPSPMPSPTHTYQSSHSTHKKHQRQSIRQYPTHNNSTAQYQPQSPPVSTPVKTSRTIIELNSADSLDLVQLYNIGPSFARRILKYRSLLGGYVDKSQLWEVYGMDSVRFNDIAPYVTVEPAMIQQMDINSATLQQLKRHPYLDYYQAKAIVQTRETSGPYTNISDLMKISIIDKQTFNNILPYLKCNSQPNK